MNSTPDGTPGRAQRRRYTRAASILPLVPIMCLVSACTAPTTGFVEREVYPAAKKQARSVDIQVFRDDTVISFTNSTATPLPACTMWINAWYSRPIDAVAIGETVEISLFDFKDQYGETFRAGGFFATQRPTKLVLAQLELENELLGLIVVGEHD